MRLPVEVKLWRKAEWARLISEREALPIERQRAARERVRAILATEVPELRRAIIGFYWPFRAEIDLVAFVRGLIEGGSRAALPVVVEKGCPLAFWLWEPGTAMRPGIWNIPVPAIAEPVEPDWTSPRGVALPHFAWIRRRALAFGGWRAEPHRTEHEQALSYAGLQRRADHA